MVTKLFNENLPQKRGKINIKSKELHERLISQSGLVKQLVAQSRDRK